VIASAILSWLIAFNDVNWHHPVAARPADILERITEPMLRPIRRFIPPLSGLDLSPVVLLLALSLIRNLIMEYGFGFMR
jgi:YggT family protein